MISKIRNYIHLAELDIKAYKMGKVLCFIMILLSLTVATVMAVFYDLSMTALNTGHSPLDGHTPASYGESAFWIWIIMFITYSFVSVIVSCGYDCSWRTTQIQIMRR